ncbi:hypothetical protein NDU88_003933 [Pleurodeles waltl]|uniref:Uncharacterized protein n=1 Tax=Pleurodeles waltl TaxID=8319 RepID=A0AAV7UFI1_PLEWA|nr:hypothetical protein NDU88_003933 [Pleurodeles waltl]
MRLGFFGHANMCPFATFELSLKDGFLSVPARLHTDRRVRLGFPDTLLRVLLLLLRAGTATAAIFLLIILLVPQLKASASFPPALRLCYTLPWGEERGEEQECGASGSRLLVDGSDFVPGSGRAAPVARVAHGAEARCHVVRRNLRRLCFLLLSTRPQEHRSGSRNGSSPCPRHTGVP